MLSSETQYTGTGASALHVLAAMFCEHSGSFHLRATHSQFAQYATELQASELFYITKIAEGSNATFWASVLDH